MNAPSSKARIAGLLPWLAFAAALGLPARGQAAFITTLTANSTKLANGSFQYSYTLTDSPQSTLPAYVFNLAVDKGANLQSILFPTGWEAVYTAGTTSIQFDTGTNPIAPGSSLSFGFTSPEPPVAGIYQAQGIDPNTFQFFTSGGPTIVPGASTVPEPSGLVLLGSGLMAAMLMKRSRAAGGRRRTPSPSAIT